MKGPEQYIVIDDDQTNNLICSYLLKIFNPKATVHLFNDPEKALQSLSNETGNINIHKKTVIFLDINMPAMSGWDFLEELQKSNPDILQRFEIYILSSSIEDFSNERKEYPYLAGFLSKPLTKAHLQEIAENTPA